MAWKDINEECDWQCKTCTTSQVNCCKMAYRLMMQGESKSDIAWVLESIDDLMEENKVTVAEALFARASVV